MLSIPSVEWIWLLMFEKLFASFLLRWEKLLSDSNQRRQRLLRAQEQYREVEDLFLLFAKKASAFNSWFENAEEDLTDPVRCNSVEEIRVSHSPFLGSISYMVMCLSSKYQVSACTTRSLGHKLWWRPQPCLVLVLYWPETSASLGMGGKRMVCWSKLLTKSSKSHKMVMVPFNFIYCYFFLCTFNFILFLSFSGFERSSWCLHCFTQQCPEWSETTGCIGQTNQELQCHIKPVSEVYSKCSHCAL